MSGIETQKQLFLLPENSHYLCGHSLGPLVKASQANVQLCLEHHANYAVSAWNEAKWFTMPQRLGDTIAELIGAKSGEVIVADNTSVNLYKVVHAALNITGQLPTECIACVGGGSNAIGLFYPFLGDVNVALTGVEEGGHSIESGKHAARLAAAKMGVLQGTKTILLQDKHGQVLPTHSISAGLDYPAVGPEHAFLNACDRASYTYATDEEALAAATLIMKLEGILPALESAHAIAYAIKRAKELDSTSTLLVNLSGRGDKDVATNIYSKMA